MNNQFLVDNQLYLNFLEINTDEIPYKDSSIDRQELCKLVENQFRKLARKYHPDYGGTNEQFRLLLDYKNKLLQSHQSENNMQLLFDESKYKSYDKTTLASQFGNQLFELISSWSTELNITPIHKPTSEIDEYEWVFKILDTELELSLNVQNLSEELAELSHELYHDDGLSILVCLFVPSNKLSVTKVAYDNSVLYTFNDKILIESSKASDITNYFSDQNNLKNDINDIISGKFISKSNNELKTKRTSEAIEKDKKVIEYLQNLKIFNTEYDEHAADFLKKL